MNTVNNLKPGDRMFHLSGTIWAQAEFVKANKTTLCVMVPVRNMDTYELEPYEYLVPIADCAHPQERLCVVKEVWRGTYWNARVLGHVYHYRVERGLYPESHAIAEDIVWNFQPDVKGWVAEGTNPRL